MGRVAHGGRRPRQGIKAIILPAQNASEAAIVDGIAVLPASHLRDVVQFFRGEKEIASVQRSVAQELFERPEYRLILRR